MKWSISKYKSIPIRVARDIAQEFEKDQVIVITWDKTRGKTHVTTYGKSLEDCKQAAQGGNFFKKAMGWPEEECKAVPPRARRKTK